ncbi:hypothetical protein P3S68_026803 [Capsicum galapagoense]
MNIFLLVFFAKIPFYQSNMSFSAAEFPPLLSLIVIFAIIIVYIVFCYLVLELMDRHDNLNDDISRMDTARGSGLSISELQEISCFYLKEQQVNYSTCAICLDGLVDADLCRSFPALNIVSVNSGPDVNVIIIDVTQQSTTKASEKILSIQMSSSAAELPSPLFLVAIIAIVVVYMVICYLVLDMIDQQVDSNDETSRMDAYGSGLSVEELQGIRCFYLEGQANSSMCVICLDSLCEAELCRSFPPCNHVFHAQCLDPWLAKRPTCPTCRSPLRP